MHLHQRHCRRWALTLLYPTVSSDIIVQVSHCIAEESKREGQITNHPISTARSVATRRESQLLLIMFPDKLQSRFPPNIVRNQKYNAFTFLPIVLYEQFKFFFNLYFLLVALSQFVPALKIGEFCPHGMLLTALISTYRLHIYIHCPSGIRPFCDAGKGGIRRLQTQPS